MYCWRTARAFYATAFTPEEKYPIPSYAASLSQLPEFRRGNKNKTEIVTGAWLSVGLHFPQKHYIIILNLFFCGRVFPEQSVVRSTSSRMMHTRYLNGLADFCPQDLKKSATHCAIVKEKINFGAVMSTFGTEPFMKPPKPSSRMMSCMICIPLPPYNPL